MAKDEDVADPDFSIDGDTGDEIDFAIVKSGTTTEHFACESQLPDSPPTAVLERRAGKNDDQNVEGSWTSADCEFVSNVSFCAYRLVGGEPSVNFRGPGSSDPDDDIVSWSIDFGDGTSTGGSWPMPPEVTHDYGQQTCSCT